MRHIDPSKVRDISPLLLDAAGRLKVVPASVLQDTTVVERAVFGTRHACYVLPTVELVERLKELIGGRRAIEIGSGNGVLARALGIPATDNHLQSRPDIRATYELMRQPVIRYGDQVERLSAEEAIAKYRPQVVVAAWVTHRYDPARAWAEGNEDGVDERALLANCEQYLFVGNEQVHQKKAIWDAPHRLEYPPYLFSRAVNGSRDFLCVWEGARPPA